MRELILHFRKMDWILNAAVVLLVAIGLAAIYSGSLSKGDFLNFKKQIIFGGVGIFLMFSVSFVNWRNFRNDPYLILILYSLCLLGLIFLFFFAPEVRGTKSWYRLGPVSIDPAEFIKIVLIILLAKYFSMRHIEMYRIWHIFLSGLYVLLPVSLIFFQPNLGSILILIAIWLGMLVVSGIKIRHFLAIILIFALILVLSWSTILKDYQKARIISFLLPQSTDYLEIGWNQAQSKIAVGSGGIFGQGFGKGSQTKYGFLPEAHTDFIFAAIAEESGLLGVAVVLIIFLIVIWRIIMTAALAKNNFPRLFASGIAVLILSQIFIHLGMNMGLLPIIGIPLPFVSYGGSGLIALFLALGILQNIRVNQ
jgi:rod shape determining protein RodA